MHIAAIDDDTNYLSQYKELLKDYNVETFTSPSEKLYNYDVYILDIELKDMNGISVAETIKQHCSNSIIIFASSFEHYVFESFKVHPFTFIRKPMLEKELLPAIKQAEAEFINKNKTYVIKSGSAIETIILRDIVYVETFKGVCDFHTTSGIYHERISINELFEHIDHPSFIFISKSCFVNLHYVSNIKDMMLSANNETLPISRRKVNEVKAKYLDYLSAKGDL